MGQVPKLCWLRLHFYQIEFLNQIFLAQLHSGYFQCCYFLVTQIPVKQRGQNGEPLWCHRGTAARLGSLSACGPFVQSVCSDRCPGFECSTQEKDGGMRGPAWMNLSDTGGDFYLDQTGNFRWYLRVITHKNTLFQRSLRNLSGLCPLKCVTVWILASSELKHIRIKPLNLQVALGLPHPLTWAPVESTDPIFQGWSNYKFLAYQSFRHSADHLAGWRVEETV